MVKGNKLEYLCVEHKSYIFFIQNVPLKEAWSVETSYRCVQNFFVILLMHMSQMRKKKKFDDKGEKCVSLGVSKMSKTSNYRIHSLRRLRLIEMSVFMKRALEIGMGSNLL